MSDINKILLLCFWFIVNIILTGLSLISHFDSSVTGLTLFGWCGFIFAIKNTLFRSLSDGKAYMQNKKEVVDNHKETFDYNDFKLYMSGRGFTVVGDNRTFLMDYYKAKRHYKMTAMSDKTIDCLNENGIYNPLQTEVIGKYYHNVSCSNFYTGADGNAWFDIDDITYKEGTDFEDNKDYIVDVKYYKNDVYNIIRRYSGLSKKKIEDMTESELYRKNHVDERYCY